MAQMLKIGSLYHDPAQLREVEVRSESPLEIVVRFYGGATPVVLKGDAAKEVLGQIEPPAPQPEKVKRPAAGLKEHLPAKEDK